MNREEFNTLLETANLPKKEFCALIDLKYEAVNNWGTSNVKIPKWVKTWLENYIERKKFESMKDILKSSGVCES